MSQIIALKKAIEDERTGAMSDYHIATRYYVDEAANYAEVGFSTYVSEAAYKAGREPVSGSGIVLKMSDMPPRGEDVKNWFYQAAAAVAEGEENGSVLTGAEFVYAHDADAIEADTATE